MNNLNITTVKGQIGISTTRGYHTMSSPKGEQTISTTKPKMTISGESPKVIIDSYECWAERGFKNNIDLLTESAQLGRQAVLKAINRIVADGNRMADIRRRTPPVIPELAAKNAMPPQYEFNYTAIPKSRPKIDVTGSLNINWQLGETHIDYTPRKPEIEYNRGKVEIYMERHPEIKIEYIDTRV